MRGFNGGAQIGLTKEDFAKLLEYAFNSQILGATMDKHVVKNVTLHPKNKYVVKIEIEQKKGK